MRPTPLPLPFILPNFLLFIYYLSHITGPLLFHFEFFRRFFGIKYKKGREERGRFLCFFVRARFVCTYLLGAGSSGGILPLGNEIRYGFLSHYLHLFFIFVNNLYNICFSSFLVWYFFSSTALWMRNLY